MKIINYFYAIRNLTEKFLVQEDLNYKKSVERINQIKEIIAMNNYGLGELNELTKEISDFEQDSLDYNELYYFYNQLISLEKEYHLYKDYIDDNIKKNFIKDLYLTLNNSRIFGLIIVTYSLPILEKLAELDIHLTDNRLFNNSILSEIKKLGIVNDDDEEILMIISTFGHRAVLSSFKRTKTNTTKEKNEASNKVKFISMFKSYDQRALKLEKEGI